MQELIKDLQQDDEAVLNKGKDQRLLLTYEISRGLRLPEDFRQLLQAANGVWKDGVCLLGAEPEAPVFHDLAEENRQISPERGLVLGYDEMDYLVYDEEAKAYLIVNREDDQILVRFPQGAEALRYFLKM